MRTNYHTHTKRCKHAGGTEEDYVLSAIRSQLDILGFSDHAPFPDRDYGLRMPYDELRPYLDAITELSETYDGKIKLLKGLEIEYLPQYHQYYENLLTKEGMDYLLLGEHFFAYGNDIFNIYSSDSTEKYLDYARAVAAAMGTGYFKAVAHPDLFLLNTFAWDKNCDKACDIIVNEAVKTNTILEYNANGYRRGVHDFPDGSRYQYPHPEFWKRVAEAKIPVIIGSDCHNPLQVWDDFVENAYKKLEEYGITPMTVL